MNVLDSKNKDQWKLHNVNSFNGFTFQNNGIASAQINFERDCVITILSKRKSGDGRFSVKLTDDRGKIFLEKEFTTTTGSWTEHIISATSIPGSKSGRITIDRSNSSFGRIQIGRLSARTSEKGIINKDIPKKKKYKEKESLYYDVKKRIAVIIPYGIYGGAEVYLRNIFREKDESVSVDFLYLQNNRLSNYLSNFSHINTFGLNKLRHKLVLEDYDSIIFYNSRKVYNLLSSMADDSQIKSNLIEIYHSDFMWSDSLSGLRSRKNISTVVRVSDGLCNDISGSFEKITIPVSIDLDLFKIKKTNLDKSAIGARKDRLLFGMVARLSSEKNIDYSIDLFKRLKNIDLMIFGDGPMLGHFRSRINREKIENVKLMLYKNNMEEYYNLFDALILTSKMEGTPISIIEALAYELPVFTTDVGMIRKSFSSCSSINFLTGLIEEDVISIGEFSKKPTRHPDSREFVLENHSSKINSKRLINLLMGSYIEYCRADDEDFIIEGELI
jgi:glycosyltransferase involved in cell wall biosynthesis